VYAVFAKLGNGECVYVASRDDLKQAVQFAQELNDKWPREYVVRDSMGNDVDHKEFPAIQREGSAVSTLN
jgi:hypothetical protein